MSSDFYMCVISHAHWHSYSSAHTHTHTTDRQSSNHFWISELSKHTDKEPESAITKVMSGLKALWLWFRKHQGRRNVVCEGSRLPAAANNC